MTKDVKNVITGHQLTVKILEGKDLKPSNYFSSTAADAFVTICSKNQVLKNSSVQYATCNPQWKESIVIDLEEQAMDDVLFITLWGKHIISRNTFLGRIEVPVTAIVDLKDGEPIKMKGVTRWFKLLPKAGSTNFDAIPGRLHLSFSYNYIPLQEEFNMVGELSVASTTSVEGLPAAQPLKQLPAAQPQAATAQDPNSKLYFQCPICTQLFAPAQINLHMVACKEKLRSAAQPAPATVAPAQTAQPTQPIEEQVVAPQVQQPTYAAQVEQKAQSEDVQHPACAPAVTRAEGGIPQEQAAQHYQQEQQYQQPMAQPFPYTYQMPMPLAGAQHGQENATAQAMARMQLAQYGLTAPQASYYPALNM